MYCDCGDNSEGQRFNEIYIDKDSARPDLTKKVLDEPTDHWSEDVIQEEISAGNVRDFELNCEVNTDCHVYEVSSADLKIELSTKTIYSFILKND
jgi:hypothetical protein